MNDQTSNSLKALMDYWKGLDPSSPFREEVISSCTKLLDSRCPLDDKRLEEYFDRLSGPEGCDFREVDGKSTWTCFGGSDKRFSEKILGDMGLGLGDIELMHEIVYELGGHCDCEIIFNAAGKMLDG